MSALSSSRPQGDLRPNVDGKWLVQVGKDRGSYRTKYSFGKMEERTAILHYNSLNTHSGYKKRLIDPQGNVIARVIT